MRYQTMFCKTDYCDLAIRIGTANWEIGELTEKNYKKNEILVIGENRNGEYNFYVMCFWFACYCE